MIRQALKVLPDNLIALIEFRSGRYVYFYPWGSAMNGQTARLEICRSILSSEAVDTIVETGTYRGVTTEWFSSFGKPVLSIEISNRYFQFAKLRLGELKNVSLYRGTSVDVLETDEFKARVGKNPFIYLDAHWEKHLPLQDEIAKITHKRQNYFILIDDFKVPHDLKYEYDDYGENGSCEIPYISPVIPKDAKIYFPTVPADKETGRKRGYVLIVGGAENQLMAESNTNLIEFNE